MARGMALAGVDPSELAPPPPPKEPKSFSEKWSNFWYHYKIHVLVVVGALLLIGWFVFENIKDDPPDYHIVVVTELPLIPQEIDELTGYISRCAADVDYDGKVEVEIENLVPEYYDVQAPTVGKADNDKLMAYLSTGERMFFVFDRKSHDGFMKTVDEATQEAYEFLAPLPTDSSDYDPEERTWSWANDPARASYESFADLPVELLFGVRAPSGTASGEQAVRDHKNGEALLMRLIEAAEENAANQ